MSYQHKIIKLVVLKALSREGIYIDDESELDEMLFRRVSRIREGEQIALDVDRSGRIKSIIKVLGFECLHAIEECAIIISYQELEREFHEQEVIAGKFSE